MSDGPDEETTRLAFAFFNEVGIIAQLSTTLLNRSLPQGLHSAHFAILNHLVRLGDGRTPLAIASAFQVTKGTMTHSLRVLADRGLVTLVPNPEDGRSKRVYLTPSGRAFREEAILALGPMLGRLEARLDLAAMAEMLPKLVEVRRMLDEDRER